MPPLTSSPLPDDSPLWVYTTDRALTDAETDRLSDFMEQFLAQWESHDRPVTGAFEIREDRFLLVAGHLEEGDISGCGIDESVRVIERIGSEMGFSWLPSLHVFYRSEQGRVKAVPRGEFRSLVESSTVTPETSVFDVAIDELGTLRSDGLERPARESWHASVFPFSEPV